MSAPPTALEMDAILISRMLSSDDCTLVGAGLTAPRAGAFLAGLTHAPGIRLAQSLGWLDFRSGGEISPPHDGLDIRDAEPCDATIDDYLVFDDLGRFPTFFIIGGLEIDRNGNTNLWGRPGADGGWERRGAGAIGTTTLAANCPRVVIYSLRHEPRMFVESCAAISALGWGDGETRTRLGLRTPGPEACLTPAGLFDYGGPRHQMRLVARRPGWTPDRIAECTGFPVHDVEVAPELETAGEEELAVLRSRVDVTGALRG